MQIAVERVKLDGKRKKKALVCYEARIPNACRTIQANTDTGDSCFAGDIFDGGLQIISHVALLLYQTDMEL